MLKRTISFAVAFVLCAGLYAQDNSNISNSDIMNVIRSEFLSNPLKKNFVKVDSSRFVYNKSSFEIKSNIISKQKIGNDYLVIFSETSSDPMKDCRFCGGDLVASLFSNNESGWYKRSDHYFSAGGNWGDNGFLETVHNPNNKHPLFVFRNKESTLGYGYIEIFIFGYFDKMVKLFDSDDFDNYNSDCCLSLHSEIVIELKGIPYEEAFQIARQKYGKGYRFMWNDSIYTTYDPDEAFYGEGGICDPGEDGEFRTFDENDSYYNSACIENESEYNFVSNKDNLIDDLVINVSGTKSKSDIYDTTERDESFPIKETHYFALNVNTNSYELVIEKSKATFFDGNKWEVNLSFFK